MPHQRLKPMARHNLQRSFALTMTVVLLGAGCANVDTHYPQDWRPVQSGAWCTLDDATYHDLPDAQTADAPLRLSDVLFNRRLSGFSLRTLRSDRPQRALLQ